MSQPALKAYNDYRSACKEDGSLVASVDVFDTLLLRNRKSELQRFVEISELVANHITQHVGKSASTAELFWLRMESARTAYRMRAKEKGAREANVEEIYSLMLRALGANPEPALMSELIDLELDYERNQLSANPHLVRTLTDFHQSGRRVICISDMYLRSAHIERLIEAHVDMSIIDVVYSSAEFGYGKAAGALYEKVLALESVAATSVVHCGDNYHSDVAMAESRGLRAFYTPREKLWRIRRKLSHKSALRAMHSK